MIHLEENHEGYICNIGFQGKLDNITRNPEANQIKKRYI